MASGKGEQGKSLPRISDAKISEIESLTRQLDGAEDKIQALQGKMRDMLASMTSGPQALMSSAATAAKANRGKDKSSLTMQDEVDSLKLAIESLKEKKANMQSERKELEAAYGYRIST